MRLNKKGKISAPVTIVGILLLIAIFVWIFSGGLSLEGAVKGEVQDYQKFGDAIGQPSFNFISYIVGGIPSFLINSVGEISATIVILVLFIMLLFIFSDILTTFGSFSNEYISWTLGAGLAIIAANFKAVMWVAVWSFGIAAGLGVLAGFVGLAIPFIIYIGLHFFLLRGLGSIFKEKQHEKKLEEGIRDLKGGIRAMKGAGKTVKEGE